MEESQPSPPARSSTLLRSMDAPPVRTLVDIVRQTALEAPDAPALDNGSAVLTYAELSDAADAFASALWERGVGRGDKIGIRIDSGTLDLYVAIVGPVGRRPGRGALGASRPAAAGSRAG